MRMLIALTAALVLALPAWGQEGGLEPLRPPEQTPDTIASPSREREETRLARELLLWQDRVAHAEARLGADHAEVRMLRDSYRAARQNWQKLKQVEGENWETERAMLDAAMERLRRQWLEVAEETEP